MNLHTDVVGSNEPPVESGKDLRCMTLSEVSGSTVHKGTVTKRDGQPPGPAVLAATCSDNPESNSLVKTRPKYQQVAGGCICHGVPQEGPGPASNRSNSVRSTIAMS